jgi:DNA polymerase III epsilon subunit-like protein
MSIPRRKVMKARYPYLFTSLDLELNQPSDKIIQIGAVKFNLLTGQIYDKLKTYVKIDEKLCTDESICHIPKLTGITDEILEEKGIDLISAYRELREFHNKPVEINGELETAMLNPFVWGGDDSRCIREQVQAAGYEFSNKNHYCFGHRFFDVKTIFQLLQIANHESLKGGLKKACQKWDVKFEGRAHDATVDAYNTAKLAHKLFLEIRGDWDENLFIRA